MTDFRFVWCNSDNSLDYSEMMRSSFSLFWSCRYDFNRFCTWFTKSSRDGVSSFVLNLKKFSFTPAGDTSVSPTGVLSCIMFSLNLCGVANPFSLGIMQEERSWCLKDLLCLNWFKLGGRGLRKRRLRFNISWFMCDCLSWWRVFPSASMDNL